MIEPHGGKLINRLVDKRRLTHIRKSDIPRIEVCDDIILDIEKIAIGAYSPLTGFMNRDELDSVIRAMRLESGEVWTIPIFLPISTQQKKSLLKGSEAIICDTNGADIALIKIDDIYTYDKSRWTKSVYGTDSIRHPGVKRLTELEDYFAGGKISLITRPSFEFERVNISPAATRSMIKERGYKTITGFQTRNVPHRAHEYLQKIALSVTDAILIHPIIGWKKPGDFVPDAIIEAYKVLIDNYYPKETVIFAGLATAMRYAGPREAVFHAIIRKNYGCTHFVVGRDHAGVGDFYGKYDAHRIFDILPKLGIVPLLLKGPYFCKRCDAVVNEDICPHPGRYHIEISGTIVRRLLSEGRSIPRELIRPEVARVLKKFIKRAFV